MSSWSLVLACLSLCLRWPHPVEATDGQKYILDAETGYNQGDEFSVATARVVNSNMEIMRLQNQAIGNNPEKKEKLLSWLN